LGFLARTMHAQRIPWKWWHRRDWILGFHRDTIAKHNSIGAGASF
jgi:hypothetical protein